MPNKTLAQAWPAAKDLISRQNATIDGQAATIKTHEATIADLQEKLKTFIDQQASDAAALDEINKFIAVNDPTPQPLPGAKELQAVNQTAPAKPGTVTFTQKA